MGGCLDEKDYEMIMFMMLGKARQEGNRNTFTKGHFHKLTELMGRFLQKAWPTEKKPGECVVP